MAEDDPNEKSLFTRIKDCVLMELRRSRTEVKRAQCPSRSTWTWNTNKNNINAEDSELKKRVNEKFRENRVEGGDNDVAKNKEGDAREKRSEQKSTFLGNQENGKIHPRGVEKEDEKRDISHSRGVEEENDKNEKSHSRSAEKEDEKHAKNHSGGVENNKKDEKHEKSHSRGVEKDEKNHSRGIDKEENKMSIESDKEKSTDQQDSCGSNQFKPSRYYIKMQNPEAPPCCESAKPSKICPPKMRKQQRETLDFYNSRPSCRCGGCSSDSGVNR